MKAKKIIDTTAASVSNLLPAFAGLTGNPAIAAAGALIAPIIQSQISEMSDWFLSIIQKKKVIASANITCQTIVKKLENRDPIRNDDFFTYHNNLIINEKESSASRLFEGSLLKAKEEYDSKKIPFFSFLAANIYFNSSISEDKSFVLLEILSKLSYRQLCALVIFSRRKILPVGRWEIIIKDSPALQDYYDIAYEFISLKESLLIEQNILGQGMGISDYRISALGKELVILANLNSISQEDIFQVESKVDYITSSIK